MFPFYSEYFLWRTSVRTAASDRNVFGQPLIKIIKKIAYVHKYAYYNIIDWQTCQRHTLTRSSWEQVHLHDCVRRMGPVTWIIVLTLPTVVVGSNNESITIPIHSVGQVVRELYHQLHSMFVIILHEFMKNEGRKYISTWYSLQCRSHWFIRTLANKSLPHILSNERREWSWIVRIPKEVIMAYFKTLSRHRPRKDMKRPQLE
jgi:hypothetical protein